MHHKQILGRGSETHVHHDLHYVRSLLDQGMLGDVLQHYKSMLVVTGQQNEFVTELQFVCIGDTDLGER